MGTTRWPRNAAVGRLPKYNQPWENLDVEERSMRNPMCSHCSEVAGIPDNLRAEWWDQYTLWKTSTDLPGHMQTWSFSFHYAHSKDCTGSTDCWDASKLKEKFDPALWSSNYCTEWGTGIPMLHFQFCQWFDMALGRTPHLYTPWFSLLNSKPYLILFVLCCVSPFEPQFQP